MIRTIATSLLGRLREAWAVEAPDERIEGSGEVHLDPAYNGRYAAERRLQELADAGDDRPRSEPPEQPPADAVSRTE